MNIITKLCQSVDNLAQKVTVLATVSLMATVHFTPIATLAQPESESPEAAAAEAAAASALDDLAESPDLIPFEEAIADREKKEGLFNLYYDEKERLVYAEIQPEQLERTYLLQSSLSRGIGEFGLYRGMPLDAISVTLRRVRNTLEVVVPNALIRSSPGDVTEGREDQFFSDSVVMSLPIVSIGDSGEQGGQSLLVDLDPLFSPGSPVFQGKRTKKEKTRE